MTIDWQHFTPWSALLGGALIGLSAGLLAWLNGGIAGISGMLGDLLKAGNREDLLCRAGFLVAMMVAPAVWLVLGQPPVTVPATSVWVLVLAGLLVGFGTRMGAGCTSGHGVCGLARLSVRSLCAVLTFMATGFATVWFARHVLGVL